MGYYTYYKLSTDDGNGEAHRDAVSALSDYPDLWQDSCKWYDHETDMRKYSKENQGVTFRLYGNGEESPDIWVKWFRNGEMQSWRFDESLIPKSAPAPWGAA